jgi:ribosome assembly protein RRB1
MPKKATKKNKRSAPSGNDSAHAAPSARANETLEETMDNLNFEDPFEDEYNEDGVETVDCKEDAEEGADGEASDATSDMVDAPAATQAWTPGDAIKDDEVLEFDASAYTMYHALRPEWPCLSFAIIHDEFGENRTRFPHTMFALAGTQADEPKKNKLTLMKLSDLHRTSKKKDAADDESDDESDDEALDSDAEEDVDDDPVLEHINIPHFGGVNRLRSMPQRPNIIATHADTAHIHLWDISTHLASFENKVAGQVSLNNKQIQTYSGHKEEGFAMDWSRKSAGSLVTGDCSGGIHLWAPNEGGNWTVSKGWELGESAEDLQWSPTEGTVFASGDCNNDINIFDTRKPGASMLKHRAHDSDVNVISWNPNVSNLLASGSDDGVFSVWDLRKFGQDPLARFTTHTTPITSLEWHPTDESMIVVSDETAVFIYDLSIEEDVEEAAAAGGAGSKAAAVDENKIPAQLLFMHCGSTSNKEAHWHPQIPSLCMTTALTGFNVFIPSNL